MRRSYLLLLLFFLPSVAQAEEDMTVKEWLDLYVAACVGSGSTDEISGEATADAGLSLKRLSLEGALKGQVKISKSEFKLLSQGISEKMTNIQANQADKVRICMEPLRNQMLAIMSGQFQLEPPVSNGSSNAAADSAMLSYILSPQENKIINALAITEGYFGEAGKTVARQNVVGATGMSDVRLRYTTKRLVAKNLIIYSGGDYSLTESGDEYALKMRFAE